MMLMMRLSLLGIAQYCWLLYYTGPSSGKPRGCKPGLAYFALTTFLIPFLCTKRVRSLDEHGVRMYVSFVI